MKSLSYSALGLSVGLSFLLNCLPLGAITQSNSPIPKPSKEGGDTKLDPLTDESEKEKRSIRFQFEGVPYKDALQRFSQMAEKPLIITEAPLEGTLTFFDSEPYTYEEAMDVFNVILSMKGVALVEAGRYLQLTKLENIRKMPLKVVRGTDASGDFRPGQIVTVVLKLKYLDAAEVSVAAASLLSNAGSVAPLSRGQGLIITDRLESIHRIQQLLEEIDMASAAEREMKSFALKHASGAVVSELINKTFGKSSVTKQIKWNDKSKKFDTFDPDPTTYVTAVYDDASRTMVLFGPTEQVSLAESLISQFEMGEGKAGEVKIFHPAKMTAEELAVMIREGIDGVAQTGESPESAKLKARIIVDLKLNRVIASAPVAGQLEIIENFVLQVDGTGAKGGLPNLITTVKITRVFRIKALYLDAVEQAVSNATTDQLPAGETRPRLAISVDTSTRSLIVTGSPGDVQTAEDIVRQLEQGLEPIIARQTRIFEMLDGEELDRVTPLVEQLYKEHVNEAGTGPADAIILRDKTTHRLIVRAQPDHIGQIAKLISELRLAMPLAKPRTTAMVPLANRKVDQIYRNIESLVNDRMGETPFRNQPKPRLIEDRANNRVIATANVEQHKMIAQVVQSLDVLPDSPERTMRFVDLEGADVRKVTPLITRLFENDKPSAGPTPQIIEDTGGKRLIVLSSEEQHGRMTAFLEKYQSAGPMAVAREIRSISLPRREQGKFNQVVQAIQKLIDQRMQNPEFARLPRPMTLPDEPGSRLVMTATKEQFEVIEQIVATVTATPEPIEREVRLLRLKDRNAKELIELAKHLFDNEVSPDGTKPQIIADSVGSRLVVIATEEEFKRVEQFVLDYNSGRQDLGPHQFKFVDVPVGQADEVVKAVSKLYQDQLRDNPDRQANAATILADSENDRVIISGPQKEVGRAEGLVRMLEPSKGSGGGQKVTEVVRLKAANAQTVSGLIEKSFNAGGNRNKINLLVDEPSNSLVLSGAEKSVAAARSVIRELDSGNREKPMELRILELRAAEVTKIAPMVNELFTALMKDRHGENYLPKSKIISDEAANRLIITGQLDEIEEIDKLVKQLDSTTRQSAGNRIFKIQSGDAKKILDVINKIFVTIDSRGKTQPRLNVAADEISNLLIVAGTPEDILAVGMIVEQLDVGNPLVPKDLKVIELPHAEGEKLAQLAGRVWVSQMRSVEGNGDVTFIHEPSGKRLIIVSPTELMTRAEQIVNGLLVSPESSSREVVVIELEHGNASELVPVLSSAYEAKVAGLPGIPASILSGASSKQVVVMGTPEQIIEIRGMASELDAPVETIQKVTESFRLSSADEVDVVSTMVKQIYESRHEGLASDPADAAFLSDAGNRRLIVVAKPDHIEEIKQLVKQVQVVGTDRTVRQSKSLALTHIKGAEAMTVLSQVFSVEMAATEPARKLILTPSTDGGSLFMDAPEDLAKRVETLLVVLDQPGEKEERSVKLIKVGDATEVARLQPLVEQLYTDRYQGNEQEPADAKIVADPISGNLIVSGRKTHLELIGSLIKELKETVATVRQSKSLALTHIKGAEAMTVLSQVFSVEMAATEPARKLILTPSTDGGSLFMDAPEDLAKRVETLLVVLDQPGEKEERSVKLIKVGDATEVARLQPLVEQLYTDRYQGNEQEPADAKIIADPVTGTLVVSGRESHVLAIEKMIAELGLQKSQARPRVTRVYDLKNAQAATLATTVTQLYEEKLKDSPGAGKGQVLVLPDAATNRLIVMAPDNELPVLEELISQVDQVSLQTAGTRVFKLKANEASQVANLIKSTLVNITAAADPKSNTLIVSGEPEDLQAAAVIIEQLDNLTDKPNREVQVFTLVNSPADAAALQAKEVYLDQMKGKNDLGDSDAMILPDASGNRLIVTANVLQLPLIKDIITTLDQETASDDRKMVVHALKNGSATSVMSIIANVYASELERTDAALKLSVTASVDDKSLVVSGQPEDLAKVAELVATLDAPTFTGEVEVRSYRLPEGDTGDLAEALNNIFKRPDGTPGGAIQPKFEADDDTRHLLVAATADQFDRIEKLIEDFQSAAEVTHGIKTFRLAKGNSEEIAKVLREMLGAEETSSSSSSRSSSYYRSRYSRSSPQKPKAKVTSATAINAIIVQGTPSQLAIAEELVQTLEKMDRPESSVMEVIHLEKAEAASVADAVNRALQGGERTRNSSSRSRTSSYRSSSSSENKQEVTVTPEVNSNSLVIVGPAERVKSVTELVRQLDIKGETEGGVDIRIYKLENGEVKSVSQTLEDMIERVLNLMPGSDQDRSRRRFSVRVWGHEDTKTLFVLVPPRQFALVEKLLPMLDQKSEEAMQQGELRFYPVKNTSASRLSSVVEDIVDRMAMLTPGSDDERRARQYSVRFWSHTDSNTIIAVVPPDLESLTKELITMLDTSSEVQERLGEIQVFPLKFGEAEDVANMLEEMVERMLSLNPKPGLTSSQMVRLVRIWPHEDTNSLFVLVPPDYVDMAKNLVGMLDVKPDDAVQNAEIQLFQLQHSDAEAVGEILESMVERVLTLNAKSKINSRQIENSVEAWPNVETNSLFVLVPKDNLPMVTNLLSMLDAKPERMRRAIHYIMLENADADTVANQIKALFIEEEKTDQPFIESDFFMNSITIIATQEQIAEMSDTIAQLDEAAMDNTLQLRVISSEGVPAKDLAEMLTGLYSNLSGVDIRLVEDLPEADPQAEPLLKPEQNQEKEVMYIAIDQKINAILASGKANELDRISRLIDDLTITIMDSEAEFRRYALKEADPEGLAKALLDIYARPEKTVVENGKTKKVPQPPKIVAVPDLRTRSVIVRAEPLDFEFIELLVKELDVIGAPQVEMRFFVLRNAKPEDAITHLEDFFKELKEVRPGEPLEAKPDKRTKSVVVVARPEMLGKIGEVIERIDVPPEFAEADVLILELRKSNAETLSVILQDMIRPDSKGNLTDEAQVMVEQVQKLNITDSDGQLVQLDLTKPIKVFGESGDGINRLIITSTADNMVALQELVRMMDTISVIDGVVTRMVTLENAEADNVRETLSGIFSQSEALGQGPGGKAEPEGSGGRALVNKINIGADDRTNSIIMSGHPDSVDLAERLIVDLDKQVENFVTDVKVYPLKHATTDQIVPMLQSVFKENSTEPSIEGISRQVTRLRLHLQDENIKVSEAPVSRDALTIQGDESSNTIIVAARSDLLPLIEEVIKTLDIPAAGGMESIQIYPLEHANAATIENVIENLFEGPSRGRVRPEDRPNIVVDSRTNALIIAASQKTLGIVNSLIKRLDQKPETLGILIEVLPLKHNDSSQVAGMINDVFNARRRNIQLPGQTTQPQERVNVEADGLTNSLIITASKENVGLIRELVAKVDLEPTAETSQLTIVSLEYADAQRAAAMLRSLIKQGLYRPGISRSGSARASRESIAISVDHATNTLIISASPENLVVVREVVAQIDTKNYAKTGSLKIYELKYASAPRLATTLESFFKSKRVAEASLGEPDAIVPITVTPDERTNTLLVTGGKESFAIIDELLSKLDADAVVTQNKFEVFPLKNGSAAKLKTMLDRLFTGRTTPPGGQTPQPVTIIADPIANSLVIGAATEDLPMVRDLVERLDAEQTSPDINVAVFPLAKANATSVSQIIQSLYRDTGTTVGPSVAINVDDRINALVVSAGENDLKRIEELAKQLDTDEVKRVSEIRVFGLKHASATGLALLLNTALNTKPDSLTSQSADRQELLQFITRTNEENELITTGLKEGVLITPDPRTNSLVVSAPVDNMPLIEQIIAKLDSSSPQIAQIKVFQLINADARQMSDVLSNLFQLQAAGGQANTRSIRYTLVMPTAGGAPNADGVPTIGTAEQNALTVTVDVRTNSLLIGGSQHYVALSSQIIEELDSSPAQERITKVYRLKNSQAEILAAALQAFLDQAKQRVTSVLGTEAVGTAQRLLDEEVAIVAEPNSNALLVSASPRYFAQVETMIEELDQPQKQVLIQVLLAEVTLDGSTEWGMQWTSDVDLQGKSLPGDSANVNSRFGLDPSSAGLGGLTATLTGDNWGFILRAMQSDGRLEILSRPQILAVDNMEATIDVGQRVPVVTGSRVTERGDSINTFNYETVGVQLTVTPRINTEGTVKMDVSPTISSLSSSSVAVSSGFTVPIINSRSATTTVSVQDGQTVVIGGLISTEDDERVTKIPWLGDIPYIGAAFKRTKKTRVRSELLIILTPHVIIEPSAAEKFSREHIDESNIFEQFEASETKRNRTQQRILDDIKPKAREEKGVEVPQPGKVKEPLPSKI